MGVSVQWGSLSGGWSLSRQVSVQVVSVQGCLCPEDSLSKGLSVRKIPSTVTSRRYTSCWNALLLPAAVDKNKYRFLCLAVALIS